MITDRERTLALVSTRQWPIVLLGVRSKKPVGKHWQITTDVDLVARHLRDAGNLGLVCHQRTGVAALDPDRLLAWAAMIDMLGQPSAAWVQTGSGKLHYYIQWCPDLPPKLKWDGEIIGEIQRGPGQQQVVIPPSIHPDTGHRYRWIVDDPATQPLEPLPSDWRIYLQHDTYAAEHGL